MKFPYVVLENLDDGQIAKWEKCYTKLNDKYNNRDRKVDEGIWRRTQMFGTRKESGWRRRHDARRRMLHYSHYFDVIENSRGGYDLCMLSTYLWIHLTFPKAEIEDYIKDIQTGLKEGDWELITMSQTTQLYKKEDLLYKITKVTNAEEDIEQHREFPDNYIVLEIKIYTKDREEDEKEKKKAWGIFNNGPRIRDLEGDYEEIESINDIIPFLPAQVELGCGPSIELGIPPLNFLHDVYYVTDKETKKFILGHDKDKLAYRVAADADEMYKIFSVMYTQCFIAEPTSPFYIIMKKLYDLGKLVGPILTNNFDSVPLQMGLDEICLRRYEEELIRPQVTFDSRAKSLISIGCHADRRRIQESARNTGLKVIHIDPEGYLMGDDFISYPLEAKKMVISYTKEKRLMHFKNF